MPKLKQLQNDKWIPVLDPELKPITFLMREDVSILQTSVPRNQTRASHILTLFIKIETKDTENKFYVDFWTHDNRTFSKVWKQDDNGNYTTEFSHDKLESLSQISKSKLVVTIKQMPAGICACLSKPRVIGDPKEIELRSLINSDELTRPFSIAGTRYIVIVHK